MLLTARTPSRYASALAALSVFMAALLLPLSFTGGVMTTPAIQQSLGGSPAALSWLTNGFMLTFGSFFAGRRGDGGCHRQKTYFYRRRRGCFA
ncbi:major facilitator superfamily protein [Klebsiella pneumoniae]|nr:major facilitator superfamily protein [Klebsiella pneumoniae]